MKRGSFAAGFLTCLLVVGITTTAYAAGIMAERSTHRIVVDGKEVQMEAYVINGNNYVRLGILASRSGLMSIGTAIRRRSRSRQISPTPEPHPSRLPQPPQTVPGMFPRWVM